MKTKSQVPWLWIAVVLGSGVVAGVACIDADLGAAGTCFSDGQTYRSGDQFFVTQTCSQCTCKSDGSISCVVPDTCGLIDGGRGASCTFNGSIFPVGEYYDLFGCSVCRCEADTHLMDCSGCDAGAGFGGDTGTSGDPSCTSTPSPSLDGGVFGCDLGAPVLADGGADTPHIPWTSSAQPCGWCSHDGAYWPPGSSFVEASDPMGECDSCVCSQGGFRCVHDVCSHFDGGINYP